LESLSSVLLARGQALLGVLSDRLRLGRFRTAGLREYVPADTGCVGFGLPIRLPRKRLDVDGKSAAHERRRRERAPSLVPEHARHPFLASLAVTISNG
jgi:hypothetical protein